MLPQLQHERRSDIAFAQISHRSLDCPLQLPARTYGLQHARHLSSCCNAYGFASLRVRLLVLSAVFTQPLRLIISTYLRGKHITRFYVYVGVQDLKLSCWCFQHGLALGFTRSFMPGPKHKLPCRPLVREPRQ
jgi:hypothetical protein